MKKQLKKFTFKNLFTFKNFYDIKIPLFIALSFSTYITIYDQLKKILVKSGGWFNPPTYLPQIQGRLRLPPTAPSHLAPPAINTLNSPLQRNCCSNVVVNNIANSENYSEV